MRIAVVSDIHGNRTAFGAVLADLRETAPDLVFHGGDLAQGGSHPGEIIDQVRALGWPGVQGNTDEVLWAPQSFPAAILASQPKVRRMVEEMISAASGRIGENQKQWLKFLPKAHVNEAVAIVHASPGNLWQSPVANATDAELESTYGSLGAKIVVYGHIHQPFVRALPDLTVANSGSVSLSYDGDPRASYLLIHGGEVTIRRVEYDVEREIRELKESRLPHSDWTARILRAGKYCPPE